MSGKCPSALSEEPKAKKKQKATTTDVTLDVIDCKLRGEHVLDMVVCLV